MKRIAHTKGFTIFFATLVGSLSIAIGIAIYDLTVREIDLSSAATQSQFAVYAADTGVECALYWDLQCPSQGGPAYCAQSAGSAFATSSLSGDAAGGIWCNGWDMRVDGTPPSPFVAPNSTTWNNWIVDAPLGQGVATTTFYISFLPNQPYCVKVEVGKSGIPTKTTIISHGFNTCEPGAGLRLERALQVNY